MSSYSTDLKGTFPKVFSQAATSQMCNLPIDNLVIAAELGSLACLATALGPLANPSRSAWLPFVAYMKHAQPNLWKVVAWEVHFWEVASWEIVT